MGDRSTMVAPERIEQELTRRILRGDLAPGERLPSVRALAAEVGVNPNTVQRAFARLEAKGLADARRGSGVVVRDPEQALDLSLVPDRLLAFEDDPDRSAAVLADLLEVRRVLAARLIEQNRAAVAQALADLVSTDLLDFDDGDLEQVRAADMALAWAVAKATGNSVVSTLLAAVERAFDVMPQLVRAIYHEPNRNRESMAAVAVAIFDGSPGLAERVEATMAAVDARSVDAYRRLLADGAS